MLTIKVVRLSSSQSIGFAVSFKHRPSITFSSIGKVKRAVTSKSRALEEESS